MRADLNASLKDAGRTGRDGPTATRIRSTLVAAETWQQDFMPYGTPCSDKFDPATQKLEIIQCELETLQKRLAHLLEEREAAESAGAGAKTPATRRRRGSKPA